MKKTKEKGITLVALVITIIIMLILAGVTITQLTKSGLFEKVKLAKEKSENAQQLENTILSDYEEQIALLGGNRDTNLMQDFSINVIEIKATNINIEISETRDKIKAYVVFINGDYKLTSTERRIEIKELKQSTEYNIIVVAIDDNYNSKKQEIKVSTIKDDYLIKEGITNTEWEEYYEGHTTGSLTLNDGFTSFNTGGPAKFSNYHTKNKINLTDFSKINFYGKIDSTNSVSGHFYISTSPYTNRVSGFEGGTSEGLVKYIQLGPDLAIYTIDVSDLTGEYYVGVCGSFRTISLYNVYLEK